jgi:RNA polymerase sigma-70 factor (sigma-E family)
VSSTEEFTEFARAASPRLLRTAFLLCGNWHTAEDLAQAALARVFASWWRITQPDAAFSYASRTMVNLYVTEKRTKRSTEVITDMLPERPSADPDGIEQRIVVLNALATLPPKARVVVVMRYWADMSVEQVADLLGCSTGTVKSQSARALGKLRDALADCAAPDDRDAFHDGGAPEDDSHETKDARHG